MDCFFQNLPGKNCGIWQRCIGIEYLIRDLNGNPDFAKNYARYIWYRSFLNKLSDIIHDFQSKKPWLTKIMKSSGNFMIKIWQYLTKDPYHIDHQISSQEQIVKIMEDNTDLVYNPIEYFKAVGKGYGIIFKYAAIGAQIPSKYRHLLTRLGELTGCLVAMRDSYKDLSHDIQLNHFNPFSSYSNAETDRFYRFHCIRIESEISHIIQALSPILPRNSTLSPRLKNSVNSILCYSHNLRNQLKNQSKNVPTRTNFENVTKGKVLQKILMSGICFLPVIFPSLSLAQAIINSPLACRCGECLCHCEGDTCVVDECCCSCEECCQDQCSDCCGNCTDSCCDECGDSCCCGSGDSSPVSNSTGSTI